MNGRIYDPKLGRMLSPDPITQAPENGQNYNRYTYAYNNPLKFTDPSGYTSRKILCWDACNVPPGAMEHVVVTGSYIPSPHVVGNQAALSFSVGQSGQNQVRETVERNNIDQAEVLQLEQDLQNGAIVGKTAAGDLVDSTGNVVQQFDYFNGNYYEWGNLTPQLSAAIADVTTASFGASAILGLVGVSGETGFYYDSETGEFGIFFVEESGMNLVSGGITAGIEISGSFNVSWNIPSLQALSGDGVTSSGFQLGPFGGDWNFTPSGESWPTFSIGAGAGAKVVSGKTTLRKLNKY